MCACACVCVCVCVRVRVCVCVCVCGLCVGEWEGRAAGGGCSFSGGVLKWMVALGSSVLFSRAVVLVSCGVYTIIV